MLGHKALVCHSHTAHESRLVPNTLCRWLTAGSVLSGTACLFPELLAKQLAFIRFTVWQCFSSEQGAQRAVPSVNRSLIASSHEWAPRLVCPCLSRLPRRTYLQCNHPSYIMRRALLVAQLCSHYRCCMHSGVSRLFMENNTSGHVQSRWGSC